ncbi:MAG: nucleoside hydrolase [Pseudomonadota bacterium]
MIPQKILIDTDPGIDDAMAVLFACQHSQLDVLGLTSIFGNVTVDVATRNALRLVELAGQDIPVARGADGPLAQPPLPVADFIHGTEGFGHIPPEEPKGRADRRTAAHFICDQINHHPGEIILCPIGPLTNLALALEQDHSIAEKVKNVRVMGTSLRAGGNATAVAEANIWQDPHAAEVVFGAPWDVTLVGLDVTYQAICTAREFAALAEQAPKFGGFLNQAAQIYFDFHEQAKGIKGCYMHDAMAVISIIRPDLFQILEDHVEVILDGEHSGATRLSLDPTHARLRWCADVDAKAVKEIFFTTLQAAG